VSIEKTSPEFALLKNKADDMEYTINWIDANLSICRVRLPEPETKRQMQISKPLYFEHTRMDARSIDIPPGMLYHKTRDVYKGILPRRIMLIIWDTNATSGGVYEVDPVRFPAAKYNISRVQFYVDEVPVLSKAYTPGWYNPSQYLREYLQFCKVMGLENKECSIDCKVFKNCYTVFAADIHGFQGQTEGNVSVELNMSAASKNPFSGLVIAEYNRCVTIDSNNAVNYFDY